MIRLKPQIILNYVNGKTFKVLDNTGPYDATLNPGGYGGPNTIAAYVTATRFIFSSLLNEQQAETNVTSILAGREYIAEGTGSFVYDTKTVNAGDTFIFELSGTPTLPSTITLRATGRFSPVLDFVPTDVETSDVTPSLTGVDSLVFPDTVGSLEYSIYTTSYLAGVSRPAGTYVVTGDTITISGVTYRPNEIFTQVGVFTFTGSGTIHLYNATTTDPDGNPDYVYFVYGFYAFEALMNLQKKLTSGCCGGCKEKVESNTEKAWNIWCGISDAFAVEDGEIDINATQCGLEEMVSLYNSVVRC